MRKGIAAVLICLAGIGAASAAPVPVVPAKPDVIDLAPVLVSGVQPGPGLWKVTAPNGNALWILGTVSPLPAKLEWRADEVQAVIASAQEVLGPPGWTVEPDIGFFKGLTLLPAAMKAARDPHGRTLREVLPPDLYARWAVLKRRYLGRDAGVEKDRPLVASARLYGEALEEVGLSGRSLVTKVIEKAAKARGLKPVPTRVGLRIDNPRQALKEVRATALDDVTCFQRTLDVVEHQLPVLAARANAWSQGDVEALSRLSVQSQYVACVDAVVGSTFGKRRGLADLDIQARQKWLVAARGSLQRNAVTFASVPVSALVIPGGYLDLLREAGYAVESP